MKYQKNDRRLLRASIVAALVLPAGAFAGTTTASGTVALAGINTAEAPRVTQTVNTQRVTLLQHTHLAFLSNLKPTRQLADSALMLHMQLVLQPSALRRAALATLITDQHNPASGKFHQWLTPQQFGNAFGVTDSDVAAAASWLVAQGFTVNTIYPNKTQIDFSGTAGQIQQAFHTQEAHYIINGEDHIANTGDISVPTALQPVIAGVMGLNNLRPQPQHVVPRVGQWNAATHRFELPSSERAKTPAQSSHAAAVSFVGGTRGLVPNDMAKMYGVIPIRANGVTGKGITIAVVEDYDMHEGDWTNFVAQFHLGGYGGTFKMFNPQPPGGGSGCALLPFGSSPACTVVTQMEGSNCYDPDVNFGYDPSGNGPQLDETETLLDAEYVTAMAPGANVEVAVCADNFGAVNFFGGVFTAADNLINAATDRPDIISTSYGFGELYMDSASKAAIDLMWAQADAEGISVFVSSGDSGSNPSYNGSVIGVNYGVLPSGVDANGLATSPNVTAVGGTDTADVLDGTTSQYFRSTPNVAYGTALGYVPEIPWNESCGNGVAAKAYGYASAVAFCESTLQSDPYGYIGILSEAGSGGPSSVDRKPAWQRQITGAARDQSRDLPDVSLFAGSYGNATWAVICTMNDPCAPGFTTPTVLEGGTSLAAPMFAGLQALIDQGIAMRGLPADQGNAAPTLYALAAQEYGTGMGSPPASLAACNADNGNTGTADCVFHNVTRGSISTNCLDASATNLGYLPTPDCYFYHTYQIFQGTYYAGGIKVGLTSTDASQYGPQTKAYSAQPGWSFAAGLGSVNTKDLLIAWRAFVHAPSAAAVASP